MSAAETVGDGIVTGTKVNQALDNLDNLQEHIVSIFAEDSFLGFLAMLVALHPTPFRESVGRSFKLA